MSLNEGMVILIMAVAGGLSLVIIIDLFRDVVRNSRRGREEKHDKR